MCEPTVKSARLRTASGRHLERQNIPAFLKPFSKPLLNFNEVILKRGRNGILISDIKVL